MLSYSVWFRRGSCALCSSPSGGLLSAFYLAGMQRPPPILIYVPPSLRYEQNSSGSQQVQCSLTRI